MATNPLQFSGLAQNVLGMKPDIKVDIQVNAFDTNRMIERTFSVLTGMNLENFLRGPAHEYLEDEIVQRFAHDGDKKSGHWPELSPATKRIRSQHGYSEDEINIRSGEMFRVLTHDADYFAGAASAEMSLPGSASNPPVMRQKLETAAHGSNNNPMGFGPTPPRPVLAVDEEDMAALLETLNVWLIAEISGTFI